MGSIDPKDKAGKAAEEVKEVKTAEEVVETEDIPQEAAPIVEEKPVTSKEVEEELTEEIEKVSNFDFDIYSNSDKYVNVQLAGLKVDELRRLRYIAADEFKSNGGTDTRKCPVCVELDEEIKKLTEFRRGIIMSVKF